MVAVLKSSGVPIALLNGNNDPFINKEYLDKLDLPNTWKQRVLYFENEGHSLQIENTAEFNATLLDFAKFVLSTF